MLKQNLQIKLGQSEAPQQNSVDEVDTASGTLVLGKARA